MQEQSVFKVWGANNRITIIDDNGEHSLGPEGFPGLDININGSNNNVRIEMPLRFSECRLVIVGDNNSFSIRSSNKTRMLKVFFYLADGCAIDIGRDCHINNNVSIMAKEKSGCRISIGNNCAIAMECILRCGDGHTLVNEYNGEPLNEPDDITIGNHVWIGARTIVLKRSYIAENSVVGAMSLVNKRFDIPNILIGGVPAKIIKSGINWDLADYQNYMEDF